MKKLAIVILFFLMLLLPSVVAESPNKDSTEGPTDRPVIEVMGGYGVMLLIYNIEDDTPIAFNTKGVFLPSGTVYEYRTHTAISFHGLFRHSFTLYVSIGENDFTYKGKGFLGLTYDIRPANN